MSSKNKGRSKDAASLEARTPSQEAERLIAKGWLKDAIKKAKIAYRDEPNPEHHRLLERAYLLRAQELRGGGMPMAAQEVALQLAQLGITDPDLVEPSAALMMAVGLSRQSLELQARLATSPEAVDRLRRQAADVAVLHPERATSAFPEILDGAKLVRQALERLAAGEGSKALDDLREIPRNSPLADWRWFARGLVAFQVGETADTQANWSRLDPARSASKIARTLSGTTTVEPSPADAPPSTALESLERLAFGEPVLARLRELGDLVARGQWPDAIRKLEPVRLVLRRIDPKLAIRLTQALYPLVIQEATGFGLVEGTNLIKGFLRAAEPWPIDPRWNRLWALVWEGPQGHPEDAAPFWRRYLDDLASLSAIRPEDQALARAVVLTHQGREWAAQWAVEESNEKEAEVARRAAITLFEQSLDLAPQYRAAYQELIDLNEKAGQADQAARIAERLLKTFPDDLDALATLAVYHKIRDEPARSLEFVVRSRALKPLDQTLVRAERDTRLRLARKLSLESRWDEARLEFETAAWLLPETSQEIHFVAQKACLEIRAGQAKAADEVIAQARLFLSEPTALWLAMAIEAQRQELPQTKIHQLDKMWEVAALGKVRSDTAGALANLLAPVIMEHREYPERERHIQQVADYLRRTTRIKYSRGDLKSACMFLGTLPPQHDLAEKLVKRGVKLFPEAPEFLMFLGLIESKKTPYYANYALARRHLHAALQLAEAQAPSDLEAAELISKIKTILASVEELNPFSMGRSLPGGPAGSFFDTFRAMMDREAPGLSDNDDESDDEDDDDRGPAPAQSPAPASGPRPRPVKKKKQKKKK